MSSELNVDLVNVNSLILRSDNYLDRIILTKKLTLEDANFLEVAHELIYTNLIKQHQIAIHHLKRVSPDLDIYNEKSISKDHWVEFLVNLSTNTEAFFKSNYPNMNNDRHQWLK